MTTWTKEQQAACSREWTRRNQVYASHMHRAKSANRRAREYGVEGTITARDVAGVIDGKACVHCGTLENVSIDHVIPMNAGGPNVLGNLQALCKPCNSSKFRSDRPGRWSRTADACVDCGEIERRHKGHGLCTRCHLRWRYQRKRAS